MKNTKVLTVLGVILAMGLAGCKAGDKSKSTEPGSKSVAPTSQTSSTPAGKSSSAGGGSSVAPTPSYVAPVHHWSSADTDAKVEADADLGTVGYVVRTCTDHTGEKGIEIAAKSGKLVDGGKLKADSSFPDYMKLDKDASLGNGDNGGGSIEYKFEYDHYAKGTIFQHAVMDYWHDGSTDNQNRGYYFGKSDDASEKGNFKLEVNGKVVDMTKLKEVTYGDMLPEEKNTTGNNYSQLGYCEIGEIVLHEGINTVKYTRLDSYNMVIKDFLLAVKDEAHEHTMSGWTKISDQDCEHAEMQKATCSVCGAEVTRANPDKPALGHSWGTATEVAAEGMSKYMKSECARCHATKLEFEFKSYIESGSTSKDAFAIKNEPVPNGEGFFKLNKNGNFMNFKFNYDKVATGKIYQRGVMDNFNNGNTKRAYTDGGSGTENGCNFIMTVNGVAVNMDAVKNIPIDEMSKNGVANETLGEAYSPVWDCEIGEIALDKGVNTFQYKRLGSYNLCNSHFVLIVNNTDHEHAAATSWSTNEEGHWHACSDANCPIHGLQLDYAKHTMVADTAKTDVPATETTNGKHFVKCSVCGYESYEELPKTGHTFVEGTKEGDITPIECSGCHATGMQFNGMADNTIGSNKGALSSGKINKATTMTWNLTMPKAGKVTVAINAKCSSGNEDKAFTAGWAIKGGASAEALTDGTLTLDVNARADSVLNKDNYVYLEIGNVTVTQGAFVIAVTTYGNSAPARLLSDGLVRVYYEA